MRKEREFELRPLELLFGEGLLDPTLSGEKRVTLRKYRPEAHDFQKDDEFRGKFKDGFDVWLVAIADTEVKTFQELTDDEAKEDGFLDAKDAYEGMHKYYPDLKLTDKLAIIRFDTVKGENGKYIASPNEHL